MYLPQMGDALLELSRGTENPVLSPINDKSWSVKWWSFSLSNLGPYLSPLGSTDSVPVLEKIVSTRCYRLCWLHSINLANQTQSTYWATNYFFSQQNGLQCPWQLTLWHHVVNSSRQAGDFQVPILIGEKRLSSTLMSLYQCVSFGPARQYLASVPGRQASCSSSLKLGLTALWTWTRCSRSGSSRRPGLC
jgi:hypothetical protein